MKLGFPILIAFVGSRLAVCTETVTLFGFQPNGYPDNAVSLSPDGVGADGATTYVEEIFQTAVVYGDSQTTGADSPIPVQTLHATLVADASVYRYSMLPTTNPNGVVAFSVIETCTLDGKGGGHCVAEGWEDGGETVTTTFTGPVTPFCTLIVDDTAQSPSSNKAAKLTPRLHSSTLLSFVLSLLAYFAFL